MKKQVIVIIIIVFFLTVVTALYFSRGRSKDNKPPKPVSLLVSAHSEAFNRLAGQVLDSYYKMTDGFAAEDTSVIGTSAVTLKQSLDSLDVHELQKDSLIYETALDPLSNAQTEAGAIATDPSMDEKKGSLNILSDNLRNLLVIIKYDQQKVYWQECPVAFPGPNPGNWLSSDKESKNPYFGLHPKYQPGSPEYGGPKDTIQFSPTHP